MRTKLLASIAATALVVGIGAATAQTDQHKDKSTTQAQGGAKQSQPERRGEQGRQQTGQNAHQPRDQDKSKGRAAQRSEKGGEQKAQRDSDHSRQGASKEHKSGQATKQTGESRKTDNQPNANHQDQRGQASKAEQQKPTGTETRGAQRQEHQNKRGQTQQNAQGKQGQDQRNAHSQQGQNQHNAQGQQSQQGQQGSRTGQAQSNQNRQSGQANTSGTTVSQDKQTRITETLSRQHVQETRDVNISVRVGETLPRSVHARPLPREIVQIAPEYRGKEYVVVRDEIVIVEPRTHHIVAVMPRSGGGSAVARGGESHKLSLTPEQRRTIKEIVINQEKVPPVNAQVQLSVGTPVAQSVEVRSFPMTVTEKVPPVRSYEFFVKGNEVAVVDPNDHRIVDVIE